jgi:septal ring factor EnvC (AmiA/AmiB activator)
MWELLLQLRVLLPYLAQLVPLLDRGLLKTSPDFTELSKRIADMQTGSRDLEVQARNQALQLERIEEQMARLRVVHENSIEESRRLFAEVRSLRRSLFVMGIVILVLLLVSVGMVAFLLIHP